CEAMADAYPELMGPPAAHIPKVVAEEERRFTHSVEVGLAGLDEALFNIRSRHPLFLEYYTDPNHDFGNPVGAHAARLPLVTAISRGTISDAEALKELRRLAPGASAAPQSTFLDAAKQRVVNDAGNPVLDGRVAFKLYDTYGLARDFIEDVCRD